MPYILLFVLLSPLVEIWIIIQVGSLIGGGWTLLAIVATAAIGLALIRRQGLGVLLRARQRIEKDEAPIAEMMEGVLLALSGLMLLIPGFITDCVGFFLLTPLRTRMVERLSLRVQVRRTQHRSSSQAGSIYEGEFYSSDDRSTPLEKK